MLINVISVPKITSFRVHLLLIVGVAAQALLARAPEHFEFCSLARQQARRVNLGVAAKRNQQVVVVDRAACLVH